MFDKYRCSSKKPEVCQTRLHACDEKDSLHAGSRQRQPTVSGLASLRQPNTSDRLSSGDTPEAYNGAVIIMPWQ